MEVIVLDGVELRSRGFWHSQFQDYTTSGLDANMEFGLPGLDWMGICVCMVAWGLFGHGHLSQVNERDELTI